VRCGIAHDTRGFVLVKVDILLLPDDHLLKHWLLRLPRMHRPGTLAWLTKPARGMRYNALRHLLRGTVPFIHVQNGLVVQVALLLKGPLDQLVEGQGAHSDWAVLYGRVDKATGALVVGVVG